MERESVFFSDGVPMIGIFGYPDNYESNKNPVAILCHGHSRQKDDGLDELSQLLVKNGYVTFRFDFRGCGDTTINKNRLMCKKEWPEDLENAITFVSTFDYIDPSRIAVAGISMGASVCVYQTSRDNRVACTVSMAGISNCRRHLHRVWKKNLGADGFEEMLQMLAADKPKRVVTGRSGFITPARLGGDSGEVEKNYMLQNVESSLMGEYNSFLISLESVEDFLNFMPGEYCERIKTPILFLHGEKDDLVDIKESEEMFERVSSEVKKLIIVENVDHNMPAHLENDVVFQHILEWFNSYLLK